MTRQNATTRKDLWQTPDEILSILPEIHVDPCAGADTSIGTHKNFTEADDGLSQDWGSPDDYDGVWRAFVNPPFTQKEAFLDRTIEANASGEVDVAYVVTPDSTDTKSWWHGKIEPHADYIWFSEGRISYIDPDKGRQGSPTFGTAISVFGQPDASTLEELEQHGHLVSSVNTNRVTFDEYARHADETAVYPRGNAIVAHDEDVYDLHAGTLYTVLGLVGEAGEVAEKIKKAIRDQDPEKYVEAQDELGDVLWYWTMLCVELDVHPATVAEENIEKLSDRDERNVIHGEGDNR